MREAEGRPSINPESTGVSLHQRFKISALKKEFRMIVDQNLQLLRKRRLLLGKAHRAVVAYNYERYHFLQWKVSVMDELLRTFENAAKHLAEEIQRLRR